MVVWPSSGGGKPQGCHTLIFYPYQYAWEICYVGGNLMLLHPTDILCVVCEKKGYIYLIEQSISPMDFFSFIFIYFFYLKLHPALG